MLQAGLTHQTRMREDLGKNVSVNDRRGVLSDFVLGGLARPPMARWSPIPMRLIVGYGFMQHGFAKLSRGPTRSPPFSRGWASLLRISWHG